MGGHEDFVIEGLVFGDLKGFAMRDGANAGQQLQSANWLHNCSNAFFMRA